MIHKKQYTFIQRKVLIIFYIPEFPLASTIKDLRHTKFYDLFIGEIFNFIATICFSYNWKYVKSLHGTFLY